MIVSDAVLGLESKDGPTFRHQSRGRENKEPLLSWINPHFGGNVLANDGEGQAHEGAGQVLRVHLVGYSFQVILLPRVLLDLREDSFIENIKTKKARLIKFCSSA